MSILTPVTSITDSHHPASSVSSGSINHAHSNTTHLATSNSSGSRKRSKAKKDPNAPRHYTSAFQLFWKEKADILKEMHEQKKLTLMDRNLIVKKFYDELEPSEKNKYREIANQDRERYIREM